MAGLNIKSVIEQIDLVDYAGNFTELNPSGSQFRGVCPICHNGNPTEFVVYDHKTFHCFVCGKSGDVINLVEDIKNVDFFTAVELLAEEFNFDIQRDPDYLRRKSISEQYKAVVRADHARVKVVKDYLTDKRGLRAETIDEFMLGANEHGDVTIPFIDENSRFVGLALRKFEGSPKYVNSKNNEIFTKAEFLFNLRGAKSKLDNALYLVEGYFCAMTLHQEGVAAVAYNSAQLSKQQCAVLQRLYKDRPELTVYIIPDKDRVALKNLPKTRRNLLSYAPDVPVMVGILPSGVKDVNDLFTAGRFDEFNEIDYYGLDEIVLRLEIDKCSSVAAEKKVAERFIRDIKDPVVIDDIADGLAERWGNDKEVVRDFLNVCRADRRLKEDFKDPEQCYQETKAMLTDSRLQYGITALDEGVRGGGRRKDVTFIGASAGAGKTFLSVQMCVDMVVRQGKNAVFFSMEMSAGALYERVLSNLLGKSVDAVDDLIRNNDPTVERCLDKLKEHLYVVDKNGLTIQQVDAYVKEANATFFDGALDVVFIDYIQYMRGCAEYQVLAETAKGMKPLAKDNDVHVIVLSQLNRGSKTWEKPSLGNLKGGGDLEASADNVFLLWREGSNPELEPREIERRKNDVKLCVAKARNGSSINEMTLIIDPNTSRMRLK